MSEAISFVILDFNRFLKHSLDKRAYGTGFVILDLTGFLSSLNLETKFCNTGF